MCRWVLLHNATDSSVRGVGMAVLLEVCYVGYGAKFFKTKKEASQKHKRNLSLMIFKGNQMVFS